MSDDEPEPNNPLAPYYPADVPDLPTGGRRWIAILLLLVVLVGLVFSIFDWVGSIL